MESPTGCTKQLMSVAARGVPAADWMRPAGRKPCCSAHRKASRCWSRRSGSTSASALATRALTSSIDVSLSLQYFSRRTSRLIACGFRAAAEGTRSLRFMKTPRERGTHAARRCRAARGVARQRATLGCALWAGGRQMAFAGRSVCRPTGDGPDKTGSGPVCGHCRAGTAIEGLTSRREGARPVSCLLGKRCFPKGCTPSGKNRQHLARPSTRAGHRGQPRRRGAMRLTTVVLRNFSVRAVVARTAGP